MKSIAIGDSETFREFRAGVSVDCRKLEQVRFVELSYPSEDCVFAVRLNE